MDRRLPDLLDQVAKEHHAAFAAAHGADPNWAKWYARKLVQFSELSAISEAKLAQTLADCDRSYTQGPMTESWQEYYSKNIVAKMSR
jgi:hypothetical protein